MANVQTQKRGAAAPRVRAVSDAPVTRRPGALRSDSKAHWPCPGIFMLCGAAQPHGVSRRLAPMRTQCANLGVPEAIYGMIIDHADGLHEGVADRRADKFETTPAQVLAHCVGLFRSRGNFAKRTPGVLFGFVADELPDVSVEAAELLLDRQEGFGVLNRRGNLESIANNARIGEKLFHFARVVTGDRRRVKVVEDLAVMFAFFQDSVPTQAGLRAFENEEFEQGAVIVQRNTPLRVVIANEKFVSGPGAAICSGLHTRHPSRYSVRRYWFASGRLVISSFFASQWIFFPARTATLPSKTASVIAPA